MGGVEVTLEQASSERYRRGRKEYGGQEWRGERGCAEAREEIEDAFTYISLERACLLRGRDPNGDDLSSRDDQTLRVIDQLLGNLRETYTGLGLLSEILDDDRSHRWEPLKFV
tara:strand:+ start:207 stop:545 length:339 start_codon:yes stop_codon:yes gene_type:complete